MEISKEESKVDESNRPILEMGITLKFTETNLFLIKMDYLCTF